MNSEVPDEAESADWKEFWESCARLLAVYPDRPVGMDRDAEAKQLERRLKTLADELLPELCASEHWVADASVGKGNWAAVPWVAFFDRRETTSAQKGVYPVIHFSCEGTVGIRIGLGIAATAYRGREDEKASEVWDELGDEQRTELFEAGFADVIRGTADRTPIGSGGLAKRYDKGMVFERFVGLEELEQSPDQLTQSLKSLLSSYVNWVETQADKPEGETRVDFLTLMQEYADTHVVFMSPKRDRRFYISEVDERGCMVQRLDSESPARVTASAFQSKLAWLREQGGKAKREELDNTTAVQVCYLQMPDLGLKADRRTAISFPDDDLRAENFIPLVHSIGTVTLYKPVILTLVIEAIREGELVDNRIEFDWLLPRFIERMREHGKEVGEQQLAEGFGRLASDLFWMLAHHDTNQLIDVSAPTAGKIRERVSHARLQEAYWQMLQDADLSKRVLKAIKNKWWPESAVVNEMPNYWIIAPGEKAKLWDRWQAEGIATIGWRETGNLSEYESQDAMEEYAESKAAARMLWQFFATMKPGDVVFAKRGRSKVCGWGIVTGDYEYDEEQSPHPSSRSVDWKGVTEYPMPEGLLLPMQTLTPMDSNFPFLCEMKGAYDGVPGLDAIDCETEEIEEDEVELIPETNLAESIASLIESVASTGFVFHPWQIATYVTAMRTKPFVILAGVSGTGKSKLPALISKLTTGKIERISVRPDWTDSSDVLGYVDLQDRFRPGVVLKAARLASTDTERFYVCLLDEMNLARVEHYFAEVLSSIEDRRRYRAGGYESTKLVTQTLPATYREWQEQTMPANFGIVGTVNMDESSHGFSRKVLDRAFTLELSEVDLDLDQSAPVADEVQPVYWPPSFWHCRATRISECDENDPAFRPAAERATEALKTVNQSLVHSQLQVGYRTRDEVILFLLNANELKDSFVTRDGKKVDPLDLALMMKVLPRLVGGSNAIRRSMIGLLGFAHGQAISESDDAEAAVESWVSSGRPDAIEGARFPRTASRLCLMWERLTSEGYTSFWL
ncbi:MAG: DUF3578 domain-containing protein [bacterium]|nr:DUF3578 domain-containing protein [bacterium]